MCSYGNGFLNNNDMYPIDLKKKKKKKNEGFHLNTIKFWRMLKLILIKNLITQQHYSIQLSQ